MKITRRQLRRLIKEAIKEPKNPIDYVSDEEEKRKIQSLAASDDTSFQDMAYSLATARQEITPDKDQPDPDSYTKIDLGYEGDDYRRDLRAYHTSTIEDFFAQKFDQQVIDTLKNEKPFNDPMSSIVRKENSLYDVIINDLTNILYYQTSPVEIWIMPTDELWNTSAEIIETEDKHEIESRLLDQKDYHWMSSPVGEVWEITSQIEEAFYGLGGHVLIREYHNLIKEIANMGPGYVYRSAI